MLLCVGDPESLNPNLCAILLESGGCEPLDYAYVSSNRSICGSVGLAAVALSLKYKGSVLNEAGMGLKGFW